MDFFLNGSELVSHTNYPVPEWLTLDSLRRAIPVSIWGYRKKTLRPKWRIDNSSLSWNPRYPECGGWATSRHWIDSLMRTMNLDEPVSFNHVTLELNVLGRRLFMRLSDQKVLFSDKVSEACEL